MSLFSNKYHIVLTDNTHVGALVDGVEEGRISGHFAAVAAGEAVCGAP